MPSSEMDKDEHESIESNESLPTCFFVAQNIFVCISVIRVRYYKNHECRILLVDSTICIAHLLSHDSRHRLSLSLIYFSIFSIRSRVGSILGRMSFSVALYVQL